MSLRLQCRLSKYGKQTKCLLHPQTTSPLKYTAPLEHRGTEHLSFIHQTNCFKEDFKPTSLLNNLCKLAAGGNTQNQNLQLEC